MPWIHPSIATVLLMLTVTSSQTFAEEERPPASRRPAAIRTDAVPDIPERVFEDLHRFQDVKSASFVDWHPRGGMVVASRIGSVTQLYRVVSPGTPPRPVTDAPDPVTSGRCLPDGSLIFSRGSLGDENFQLFRVSEVGVNPGLLTDGKSRNLAGPPDREGKRIAFTSTRRNGRDADLYTLDPGKDGESELLLQVENETWSVDDWSHDGARVILSRFVSASETYGFLLEIAARKKSPLPPEHRESDASRPRKVRRDNFRFGPGSTSVYLTSDARGELRELARLDLETGKYAWLTGDLPWDVEDLDISRDGKLAAFTINADGASRLFTLDLGAVERDGEGAARDARREVELPAGIVSGIRFAPWPTHLGFTLGSAASPTEAFSFSLPDGKLERWTSSERAGFTPGDFIEPELFRYESFDGRKVPAYIFRPRSTGRTPVIVSIHGGPEGQARPQFSARIQYHALALGAAVITPNVRGSTGYGKSYATLDDGVLREDSVRDIGALLDWIARDDRLDASRVAVMGGSYGGYMTLASLVHFGARIRAGIDVVGISNFRTFLERTSAYRRDLRRAEYGDEREGSTREFFEKISPANRIHELRSALLVVHGANDPRVPLSETEQIVARARSSGQPVWTLYASNEGHGFTRRENADYQDAVSAVFLERHLLAKPSGDDGALLHRRAVECFKLGQFKESAADFDRSVAAGGRTHSADECWERGLARYYTGDFEGGRMQFEGYHRVGPLDIENGLWLFLCVAEKGGLEKARAALPAYAQRQRKPFPALLELYQGKGSVDSVLAEASAGLETGPELRERLFYAHLYAGKYLQAAGDREKAREHFDKALANPVDHFMWWCAKAEAAR